MDSKEPSGSRSSRTESPSSRASSSSRPDSAPALPLTPQGRIKKPNSPRQSRSAKPTATKSPSALPNYSGNQNQSLSQLQRDLNDFPNIVQLVQKYKNFEARADISRKHTAFMELVDALLDEKIAPDRIAGYRRDPDGGAQHEYFCTWSLDSLREYALEGWLPHDKLAGRCPEFLANYLAQMHVVQSWRKYEILKYDDGTPRVLLLTQKN